MSQESVFPIDFVLDVAMSKKKKLSPFRSQAGIDCETLIALHAKRGFQLGNPFYNKGFDCFREVPNRNIGFQRRIPSNKENSGAEFLLTQRILEWNSSQKWRILERNSFSKKGFWGRTPVGKEGYRAEFLPAKRMIDMVSFCPRRC